MGHPLTLSNCRKLRELKIGISPPQTAGLDIVSSITSADIEKITFTLPDALNGFLSHPTDWKQLDNCLYRLADRLGCGSALEVEIRVGNLSHEAGCEGYLPRYQEKGQARFVNGDNGMTIYCSNGMKQR
jgi:hypothetical protein